jgi:hypothetical protein
LRRLRTTLRIAGRTMRAPVPPSFETPLRGSSG